MDDNKLKENLINIFFPNLQSDLDTIRNDNKRFVHYTSAIAAKNILTTKEVWLKNTGLMNDYKEVLHGTECLIASYNSEVGKTLKKAIDDIFPGADKKIEDLFNGWLPFLKQDSYLFCLSEHEESEDNLGRLSMWRAYGLNAKVALVLNNYPFIQENDDFSAFTIKVEYINTEDFFQYLSGLTKNILENQDILKIVGEEYFINLIFHFFKIISLSSKHEGFHEEREWRVIYNPKMEKSDYIESRIEVLDGIPQEIQAIKLKNIPEINLIGVEIPQIIDRIIIGPCDGAHAISKTFVRILEENNVENADQKVVISNIPLRNK